MLAGSILSEIMPASWPPGGIPPYVVGVVGPAHNEKMDSSRFKVFVQLNGQKRVQLDQIKPGVPRQQ